MVYRGSDLTGVQDPEGIHVCADRGSSCLTASAGCLQILSARWAAASEPQAGNTDEPWHLNLD